MLYVLDTNVVMRALIEEDPKTTKECKKILQLIKDGEIQAIIPGVVIAETVWVLKASYGITKEAQVKSIESILNLKNLKCVDDYDYKIAVKMYGYSNAKYVDCLIATQADKNGATVLTYDKEFKGLPVKWVTPTELLKTLPKA